MYKCGRCKKQQPAGEGRNTIVVEMRKRTYENVVKKGKRTRTIRSEGSEIVREIGVCTPCKGILESPQAK